MAPSPAPDSFSAISPVLRQNIHTGECTMRGLRIISGTTAQGLEVSHPDYAQNRLEEPQPPGSRA
jgi:hypothetical protein